MGSEGDFLGITPQHWARVLVITGLFCAVFWHNLVRLWLKTNPFTGEANWSHAVVVPIIGLYYLYIHREDLVKAGSEEFIWGRPLRASRLVLGLVMVAASAGVMYATRSSGSIALSLVKAMAASAGVLGALVLVLDWSLATVFFGLGMFVYGIYPGKNDYLCDLGMVITLFGVVLLLCGWRVMRIAWFPIVFLICAIPWPGLVYSWVAEPLSQLAARVAVHVLQITGVESACSGTKIIIQNPDVMKPPRILNVAEACAGMRSLMTFIAVGGAVAFLFPRQLWQRIIIVLSAIPIAIFCNVMRISGQGLLDHYVSTAWSESFAHQFVGMVMLLPAFFMILGVGYALDKMFIDEFEESDRGPLVSNPVSAIATRESAIPALGTMSNIITPTLQPKPTPVVAKAPPALVPAALVPATPAQVKPAVTAVPPSAPRAATPPRPVTAANPPKRAAAVPPVRPAAIPANRQSIPQGSRATATASTPPANPPVRRAPPPTVAVNSPSMKSQQPMKSPQPTKSAPLNKKETP